MRVFLIRDRATDTILVVSGSYKAAELQADRLFMFEQIRSYISVEYI